MTEPASFLGDTELNGVIHAMNDRSGVLATVGPWSVVRTWRSFKADFVMAHSDAGDVAVKFGDGWSAEEAQFVAAEVERVHGLFEQLPGGGVQVPRSLGWSEAPGAVALEYVDGAALFNALADPGHPIWTRGEEAIVDLVVQCGQAIGAYHRAQPAVDDPAITQVARDDLFTAARRAGVRRATILAVEPQLLRARGYRFSPNDFIVDREGRLVMLDPPHVRKYDYLQRDVSAFTFELHRALIGDGPLPADHPEAALLGELRAAFLAGYAATGPSSLASPLDAWMIRFYEVSRITGLAYGHLRRKRPQAAVLPLRWAVQVRRGLGSPPA